MSPTRSSARAVTWTRPELVCEVKFANWTEDGRLRAPVFVGLRPDIDPSECVREREGVDVKNNGKTKSAKSALLANDLKEATLTIDGHRLKFTNLDKIFYPKDGYRKRDLLNYYDAVAPLLLPHLKRPAAFAQALSQRHRQAVLLSKGSSPKASRSGCASKTRRTGFIT